MLENAMYYGKNQFYEIIRNLGGTWNDAKERPIIALMKLYENESIYWAIPMGNWYHRDEAAKERINIFLSYEESDIRSCFYHIGRTDTKSIFFISDIIPITDEFIEREYKSKYTGEPYVIKNKNLIAALTRKAKRILAWENANPNYYRQHITDLKRYLLSSKNN